MNINYWLLVFDRLFLLSKSCLVGGCTYKYLEMKKNDQK